MKHTIIICLLIAFVVVSNGNSYQDKTHQYIVREAYKLLKQQLPVIEASDLNDHVGYDEEGNLPWETGKIVTGAFREDKEDPIYSYCGFNFPFDPGCVLVTMTHFWNADAGDDFKWPIFGENFENAYQKARAYIYGDHTIRIYFGGDPVVAEVWSYDSLFNFYNTGNYYYHGYINTLGQFIETYPPQEEQMSLGLAHVYAYEILGRVCHLLADNGVPAHVHNDEHVEELGHGDTYEIFMEYPTYCTDWDYTDAYNAGGLLWDVLNYTKPLRYLFYTTNQYSDHYPSNGGEFNSGDNNYNPQGPSGDYYYILDTIYNGLGNPPDFVDPVDIGNNVFVYTIRTTASLLYWFATETNQIIERYNETISGTIPEDEVWGETHSLSGNVIVPSGVTLYILSGTTINLNGYYVKCEGSGEIVKKGSATFNPHDISVKSGSDIKGQYSTIVSAINNANSGQTISLSPDTYYESPTISTDDITMSGNDKNSTIINGTVTFDNVDNCEIEYLTVNDEIHINSGLGNKLVQVNTEERIVCNYGSNHYCAVVTANHGDKYGIKAYNTNTLYIDDFTSTESSKYGVYANNNSYLDLETDPYYYPYKIANKTYALQIASYSEARLDYVRFDQNVYDIYAAATASAIACNCTITGQIYGNVIIDDPQWCGGYLGQQSGSSMALSKNSSSIELAISQGNQNAENSNSDFNEGLEIFRAIKKQVSADYALDMEYQADKYLSDYQVAIDKFKKVVSEYPSNPIANKALAYISWCYWDIQQTSELKAYFESLLQEIRYDGVLKYQAKILLATINIGNKEYYLALQKYDDVLKACTIEDILVEGLYGKGVLYRYYLHDSEKAAAAFKELIDKYPVHPTTEAAMDELEHMGEKFIAKENEPTLSEFTIRNYPNPFNPETVIHYNLPEAGEVIIKVFDIQGREITTLVDSKQPAGKHVVIWGGRNTSGQDVASGMYFYLISYVNRQEKKILADKMLLMR